MTIGPWVNDDNIALLTDLYELTMLQAYVEEEMSEPAVFDLFVRTMPECRNYLIACGLDDALRALESLSFSEEALSRLDSLGMFSRRFLDYLASFRFTGNVRAVPEGTPVFADEPILEVEAPLPEAQLIETVLLNQIHLQTVLASKASRVVTAAGDAAVVDFGLRRMHGTDAGMKAARAFHIAGGKATSNVLAGLTYGIPVSGTMAHSYIEAHDDEAAAFETFARRYGETVLLVDTYDTLTGVRKVVELAGRMGDDFKVRAIRLDSGDLADLAEQSRRILDEAGLINVGIFASGGLDEYTIRDLLASGAPITGFGVGSKWGVAEDAPSMDAAYKLVEYAGAPRMKLSSKKDTLPGRKQVHRVEQAGAERDVIALADEDTPGRPLMTEVMREGKRLDAGRETVEDARRRCADERARLPERLLSLDPAEPPYEVRLSPALETERRRLRAALEDDRSAGKDKSRD